ncbi:cell envelope integrity protein CreD [uncultured Muribaculum sp.]|uniref:cell envelope integrity protein CreD n=1 Tax=uncultured Muribaculum sp. TaxID=1918613 RepID=UPI0025B1CDE7|nr:cell envelope integrity protein CreD [uncultured Muribaculum sp.]
MSSNNPNITEKIPVPPPLPGYARRHRAKMLSETLPPTTKGFFLCLLVILLTIGAFVVYSMSDSRNDRLNETVNSIADSYGGRQTISIPNFNFKSTVDDNDTISHQINVDNCIINAYVHTSELKRGAFNIQTYHADIEVSGNIIVDSTGSQPFFVASFTPSDFVGIDSLSPLKINGHELTWIRNYGSLSAHCPSTELIPADSVTQAEFSYRLRLRGVDFLGVALNPDIKRMTLNISGRHTSPSFNGWTLPNTRTVTDSCFTAQWKINGNLLPYQWKSEPDNKFYTGRKIGVTLTNGVDHYVKVCRAIKYAFLVIALAFGIIFIVEQRMLCDINLFQYLLIGLALVLFYSLLLSLSEHLSFLTSYWVSAMLTASLIAWYMRAIFNSTRQGITIGGSLFLIYGFFYIIICLSNYSLLVGSLGLFAVLAVVMRTTLNKQAVRQN